MDRKVTGGAEAKELRGQDVGMVIYEAIEVNENYAGGGIEDSDRKESDSRIFKLLLQVREAAT